MTVVSGLVVLLLRNSNFAVLDPKGPIAQSQYDLLIFGTVLSTFVVVPVFALTYGIVMRYRTNHQTANYSPEWDGDKRLELIWWLVPLALITVLGVVIWTSSHRLDPSKALASSKPPVTIQVVALQWKWLFIYPDYNIATVNYIQFPEDTPVNFVLTADAPMNSFWIPQLGGQIYAMPGMSTKLHLLADDPGEFRGSSANLSGEGFAGMKFTAKASSQADFETWLKTVQQADVNLAKADYDKLAQPSKNNVVSTYSAVERNLYGLVLQKYMPPDSHDSEGQGRHEH